jgi:hypothetical protein
MRFSCRLLLASFLALVPLVLAAPATSKPGANAAKQLQEEYIYKNIKPSSLNAKQKEYFQILKRTNEVLVKGKYDTQKVYDLNFHPVIKDMAAIQNGLQQQAVALRDKADALRNANKGKLADQCDACADVYEEMVAICVEAQKVFPTNNMSKMNDLVRRYSQAEGQLLLCGVKKLPPRNWLTGQEYRILCRKIKMSKQD